jgi:hypothetical protein
MSRLTFDERWKPSLKIGQILAWADAHYARHGKWPTKSCRAVVDAPGESWLAIDVSLHVGARGLPGGQRLARLLAIYRGRRAQGSLPPLTTEQVLNWADAFHRRTGRRPTRRSGPIPRSDGETWLGVAWALSRGARGLPVCMACTSSCENAGRLKPIGS